MLGSANRDRREVSFTQGAVRKHGTQTSRSLKQRTWCPIAISPPATGTHHSHIILLAVCRVSAGDALRRDGSTMLGRHGVHSRPEAKQTGLWALQPSALEQKQNPVPICTVPPNCYVWVRASGLLWPRLNDWYETHKGRVQDMVTGLLNGSSSMIPLFFKSRGVGFAVENKMSCCDQKIIIFVKRLAMQSWSEAIHGH